MPLASLAWDARPARAGAVALVLHGGAVDGREPNHPWSHNVARLVPFARALRKVPGPLAVARLRFRYRGWNGAEASPVEDARWALAQIRADYPDAPVALVGHSMGGRTALTVADEDNVRLVVGLSPWIERGDPVPRDGRKTVLIHGDRDIITPLSASRRIVEGLLDDGRDATLIRVARGDHAMLVRAGLWSTLVVDIVGSTFARELGGWSEPRSGPIGAVVARAVHGSGGILDI
ncbi:alpha/beta fold hydrolase [Intrasporangium calvum]|uniref:Alpha/beta hydrolase fold protein n=1 Tax=Intrasporangium calvum (strain ATCC 23552 / DSM 43043 / JCM 3097 / NBRC 12989 / NCIMB 10167 / NRRL B-3866 / 7 KIP) TaxID=710696 RepID=E6S6V1_INTC7|nr:alpha/beta fold hydrolase [Intrasporangium calvum]ADU46837.1 alpha/beta hydrolase fold protein [Intrasporangium calvum DSM 43043]